VLERLADEWVAARSASLLQQVAALRLLCAILRASPTAGTYPLTDDAFISALTPLCLAWPLAPDAPGSGGSAASGGNGAGGGDAAAAHAARALLEARQVYATGLMSVALLNEDIAGAAVKTPALAYLARALRVRVLDGAFAGCPARRRRRLQAFPFLTT